MKSLIPWRIRWLAGVLLSPRLLGRYFEETADQGRLAALGMLLRSMALPPDSGQTLATPMRIRIKGIGEVPIHSFSDFFHFFEVFVNRVYDLSVPSKAGQILDIGANIGMFTLRARKLYPDAEIMSFEPVELNFTRLRDNVASNSLGGIRVVNEGVGGASRTARIYLHPQNTGGHSIHADLAGQSDTYEEIRIRSISEVLAEVSGEIDLVKLDCEGAEHEIVMALSPDEARRIRLMLIETTFGLYERGEFLDRLARLGFHCTTHKGLLLASRDRV